MKKIIPGLLIFLLIIGAVVGLYFDLKLDYLSDTYKLLLIGGILVLTIIFALMVARTFNSRGREKIKKLETRLSMWTKTSYHLNQVGDEVFNELPIGIMILDETLEEIQWINQYASLIFDQAEVNERIEDLNTDLYQVIQQKNNQNMIAVGDKKYETIFKKDYNVIYFFDITEKENIKALYENHLPALAIITFDNLEESIVGLDISLQSQIQGEYLRALSDWIEQYEGYLKQLVDDRLLLVVRRDKLKEMIENKFSILETIRNISMQYQLRVSLSMGIASWDLPYEELATYAQNAIELAQKRGGDQVVVNIEGEKIQYFGAKVDASSKYSKVSARVNAQSLQDFFKKAKSIFVMGHNQTDLDSLGSTIAAYKMALSVNEDISIHMIIDKEKLDPSVVPIYEELLIKEPKISEAIITTEQALKLVKKESLLIVVDTQSSVIVNSPEVLELTERIIVIDHHRTGENSILSMFSYVETSASSSIELLIELAAFFEEKVDITPFEANIMYAGLLVDTNNFTYRTGARTFEVASKLKELGADSIQVKIWLRNDMLRTLEINKMVSQLEIYMNKFALVKSNQIYDDRAFLAQVSESLLDIQNIDAAFTVTRLSEDMVGISARSYNQVNVQIIMEQLGGGGHLNSAAAQIKNKSVDEVVEELKELLKLEYEEGEDMKVILLEDVKGRGKKDDVIDVANGYGQFLITSKKAILANEENLNQLKKEQEELKERELNYINLMEKLKTEIDGKQVTVGIQVGPDGRVFGKVTTKQIVEEFEKEYGITIDRKKIELSSEINSVGIYTASVSLTKNIKAQFEVNVIGEN